MDLAEIEGAEEADRFSEGRPSSREGRCRMVRCACCFATMLITLACIVLPLIGAQGFFESFRVPYSLKAHGELLLPQLVAPVLLLMSEGLLGYCTLHRKRIPVWVVVCGLIGAIGMSWNVGHASHDFSHVIFEECSGIYGDVIFWFAVSLGSLLVAIWLLQSKNLESLGCLWRKVELTWKGSTIRTRRIFGVLVIFLFWIGILFVSGILPGR
ncbi:MAG: hypothetical protein V4819_03975 [Verrucomicrobiota bacterium]